MSVEIGCCVDCGKEIEITDGVAWKMCFTNSAVPEPIGLAYRCKACVAELGPLDGKESGIIGEGGDEDQED